jgi:glycosyltransferase involved in cell wall biosynthesis
MAAMVPWILVLLASACLVLIVADLWELVVIALGAVELVHRRANATDAGNRVLLKSSLTPAVSVIAVPPDAAADSLLFVRRLLNLHYGQHEVLVVLNDPSEAALAVWKEEFRLKPSRRSPGTLLKTAPVRNVFSSGGSDYLIVIAKSKGDLADSLNAGVNLATGPYVAVADSHTRFSESALLRLICPVLRDPENIIGACTWSSPSTAPGIAGRVQALEYQRTLLWRSGLLHWNVCLPPPASLVLLNRDTLAKARGFRAGNLAMVIHLYALARAKGSPHRIELVPDADTQPLNLPARENLRERLRRDRSDVRDVLRLFGSLFLNFGAIGWVAVPAMWFGQYFRPLLEGAALVLALLALGLNRLEAAPGCALLGLTFALRILASMTAVILNEAAERPDTTPGELAALFFSSIPEGLGYRYAQVGKHRRL